MLAAESEIRVVVNEAAKYPLAIKLISPRVLDMAVPDLIDCQRGDRLVVRVGDCIRGDGRLGAVGVRVGCERAVVACGVWRDEAWWAVVASRLLTRHEPPVLEHRCIRELLAPPTLRPKHFVRELELHVA